MEQPGCLRSSLVGGIKYTQLMDKLCLCAMALGASEACGVEAFAAAETNYFESLAVYEEWVECYHCSSVALAYKAGKGASE